MIISPVAATYAIDGLSSPTVPGNVDATLPLPNRTKLTRLTANFEGAILQYLNTLPGLIDTGNKYCGR
jgi:hypothetical protein